MNTKAMKKLIPLFLLLVVIGCSKEKPRPSPSPSPTVQPSPTVGLPPSAATAIPIPTPSGVVIKVSEVVGTELSERINKADELLGARAGWIIVDVTGEMSSQVRITDGHTLSFGEGRFTFGAGDRDAGSILIEDNTAVYGKGMDKTILVEPEHGYRVIQSLGASQSENTYYNCCVTENITIAGLTIEGSNEVPEGGVRSTIELGNAHNVRIHDVKLRDTTCLGITAGGTALSGKHAEDWIVEQCVFEGVASQNLNVVNGSQIIFRNNDFLRVGKLCGGKPCEGVTAIDLEPNTRSDWVKDVLIEDNLIDSTNSPFLHGNGMAIQNTAGVENYGPVMVRRNRIIGGVLTANYSSMANGIFIAGASNTTISNNTITRVAQSGIWLGQGHHVTVEDNGLVSTGTGGIQAFEVSSQTDSRIIRNSVTVAPGSPLGTETIVESGTSDRNVYEGNTAKIVLVGANSRIL